MTQCSILDFNALPPAAATDLLLACCRADRWAAAVLAGRPYPDLAALRAAADAALATLTDAELGAALAGHPRIGDRPAGSDRAAAWSRSEQAGVVDADRAELARLNAEYERRFGHVFLIRAAGRSAADLVAALRQRLGNDPATERRIARAQLGEISWLRLTRALAE